VVHSSHILHVLDTSSIQAMKCSSLFVTGFTECRLIWKIHTVLGDSVGCMS